MNQMVYNIYDKNLGGKNNMSGILETIMLICFGASWPLSVVKNFKARSAKGMSLQFILLITLGYVAGLSAKLMNGGDKFVIVVYLINLFMVSINILIYFRNKRIDSAKKN